MIFFQLTNVKFQDIYITIDKDQYRGGIITFAGEDILAKLMSLNNKPIESCYWKLIWRVKEWFVSCCNNSSERNILMYLETVYFLYMEDISLVVGLNLDIY